MRVPRERPMSPAVVWTFRIAIAAVILSIPLFSVPGLKYLFWRALGKIRCDSSQLALGQKYTTDLISHVRQLETSAHVLTTTADGATQIQTPYGIFWIPTRMDKRGLSFMLAEQAIGLYSARGHRVKPGDVVFDCGANVGAFTRTALSHGAARVIAIEPAPDVVACLRKTFASEIQLRRVTIVARGVWDKPDRLMLHKSEDSVADSFVIQKPAGQAAQTDFNYISLDTIDSIANELGLPRVDYIKMDVEGAEQRALRGARMVISHFRPRLAIAVEHLQQDLDGVPAVVRKIRSDYQVECGPCYRMLYFERIQPDVLYFY